MTNIELFRVGIEAFMGGVALALFATLLLNLLYAFLQMIGKTFWG